MGFEIKVSREDLQKRKLFIATPMYGGLAYGTFTRSIADLAVICAQWGIELKLYFLSNESLISRARNYCASSFVSSDSTHMMFIDADIGFDPKDVIAMLALMSDDSPYDVLGGPYAKKTIAFEKLKAAVDKGLADDNPNELEKFVGDFVFNPLTGGNIPLDKPVEVLETGTGFMMIRRRAFQLMDEAYPELSYKPDHIRTKEFDGSREIMAYFMDPLDRWDREKYYRKMLESIVNSETSENGEDPVALAREALNHTEAESKRHLSEDYFWCQKLRKAGGHVWLCPWMKLTHTGTYTFGGSLSDLARIGASATADPEALKKTKK